MGAIRNALLAGAALTALYGAEASAETRTLSSPDGAISVQVSDESGQARYAVAYKGKPLIAPSGLGLELSKGGRFSYGVKIVGAETASGEDVYDLPAGKVSHVAQARNELAVDFQEESGRKLRVVFRAYDQGVAFRYVLPQQEATAATNVNDEVTGFSFPRDYGCYGLNLGKFGTSHEGEFDPVQASKFREHNLYDAPVVCRGDNAAFAIAEADLKDWAGMYLTGRGDGRLGLSVKLSPRLDGSGTAVKTRLGADVASPWRVIMIAPKAGQLVENTLLTTLSAPSVVSDTSWIKPGKAAWDWWNGPALKAVPNAGMNPETIRAYIDFAAQNGLEYMLIDEGWHVGAGGASVVRPGADVTRPKPELDLPGLVSYGADKKVGIWLWLNWKALDAQMDEALPLYEKWGIKGIKVDFMDRDDQAMVDFYHRLLKRAAEHHLMVDLHGAYHPTGLIRTYPHYLTQEGVLGAEYNKWSARITATHNVNLAYTRMLLGPMDYTPGGFRNVTPDKFEPRDRLPFVQTTRGQALAMFVVFDSPFTIVADSPDTYAESPAGLDFVSAVPTTWDEIRYVTGEIGQSIVVARRKGDEWWIGALNNETARTVKVPLAFLGKGAWKADVRQDGATPNSIEGSNPSLTATSTLTLKLAASGGAAARLTPVQ
ncbi:alpha-glucosidase [Caulobacter sp. D4A]|uniref:glycoside hydrolase family 97 protein n=1 Tax=unclassified Caulobacter TaxID=2648921 RepID=UPI000D737A9C|nr:MULTISPECIES: glycoside hydrolase family 97 protein [unclassified Caulobacter]PXA87198.1 alpha-glucosidase [Caulobacter sp. D5]PXA94424.1 alpha-glucosidase [Caulobacter sp. D4A]